LWSYRQECLSDRKTEVYFPQPPGQNGLISSLSYAALLYEDTLGWDAIRASVERDVKRRTKSSAKGFGRKSRFKGNLEREAFMDKDCAYDSYTALLKATAKEIAADDENALLKLEMTLFASADTWIAKEVADKMATYFGVKNAASNA
jgi:hypothetical protein